MARVYSMAGEKEPAIAAIREAIKDTLPQHCTARLAAA
jgi:hypothetical protein